MPVLGPSGKPLILRHVWFMLEESNQLGQRIATLDNFMNTNLFKDLPDLDRHLLQVQSSTMQAYLRVLLLRIERAHGPKN